MNLEFPRDNSNESLKYTIINLWRFFSKKNKEKLYWIIFLNILAGFSEFLSLSLVIPFINILDSSNVELKNNNIQFFANLFNIENQFQLKIFISILFILGIALSGVIRTISIISNSRYSASIGTQLNCDLYQNILNQPYSFFKKNESNSLISTCTIFIKETITCINAILNIITSIFIIFFIILLLYKTNPSIALSFFILFSFIYYLISKRTNAVLRKNSKKITVHTDLIIKKIQESLLSIRDILMYETKGIHLNQFHSYNFNLRRKESNNFIISTFPRFSLESLAIIVFILISLIGLIINKDENLNFAVLGVLAFSAQKLLPLFQNTYLNFSFIKGKLASINKVLYFLELESLEYKSSKRINIDFKEIKLKKVSLNFEAKKENVFENVNLSILCGEKIGIIGKTGAGKSTLIDLLIGLVTPSKGSVYVNDKDIHSDFSFKKSWMSMVAVVPQDIFILDGTLISNITYGVSSENINYDRLKNSIKIAQLESFVNGQTKGLETSIRENGKNLSGGQKQRIGIARALYKNCKFIIFDEATSALDSNTENKIIEAIENFDKNMTILFIAHRKSTLKICDKIYELKNSKLYLY